MYLVYSAAKCVCVKCVTQRRIVIYIYGLQICVNNVITLLLFLFFFFFEKLMCVRSLEMGQGLYKGCIDARQPTMMRV